MEDFLGLRAVWPPDGTQPTKHNHDIVFVHGLYKGSFSDWTDEDGKFWPVDRLGLDLGTARIFAYGYDPNRLSIRSDGLYEGGIVLVEGVELAEGLNMARCADKMEIPLTFIGHGTGGVVIQSTLCLTLSPLYRRFSIFQKTRHVVFLDTPGQGITQSAWERNKTQPLMWPTVVINICENFGKLADRWNITSAYGEVDKSSSGAHCVASIPPHEWPHETVLVFENSQKRAIPNLVASGDPYDKLLSRIQAGRVCITDAKQHIQRIRSWLFTAPEMLNELDHQRNLQRYHPNTGLWLFEDSVFREWSRPESDVSFLWLTGPEGCGKSVLASQAAQRIGAARSQHATARLMLSLDKPQSEYELTASLASQLLSYVTDNVGGVDTESLFVLEQRRKKIVGVHDLIRLLIAQCPAVFFFVDGIDDIPVHQENESPELDDGIMINFTTMSEKNQKQEKTKKIGRAQRHLYSTLVFLTGLLTNSASTGIPVRLWCSSTRTTFVQQWLEVFEATELRVDLTLVAKDIADYLDNQMVRMKPGPSMLENCNLVDNVGSNFQLAWWALKCSENPRFSMGDCAASNFATVAFESLNSFHETRLADIQRQESVSDKNLAREVLSILAFAKRPFKFSELQQALAILSSSFEDTQGVSFCSRDISVEAIHREFQNVQEIIQCCSPFLEVSQSRDAGSQDGWIRFSHGSTLRLLTTPHYMDMLRISPVFISTVCLKYLAQGRYSFGRLELEELPDDQHSLLPYAAKYWYRHLNTSGESLLNETKSFIQSSQFLASIQFQSLFVDQHFPKLEDLDDGNVLPRCRVRLPLYLDADPLGLCLVEDFRFFLQDWIDFLWLGTTTAPTRGQIRRCFWGSLPKTSFLRGLGTPNEYQQSHSLGRESAMAQCRYLCQAQSIDGRQLAVWSANEARTDSDLVTIVRTSWAIDGERPPCRLGPDETLTTSREQVLWDMYLDGSRSRKPLVPALDNSVRGSVMQEIVFGLEVRVGNQRFTRQDGGTWIVTPMENLDQAYWEDIVSRGDYVVRSRRKLVALGPEGSRKSLEQAKIEERARHDEVKLIFSWFSDNKGQEATEPPQSDLSGGETKSKTSAEGSLSKAGRRLLRSLRAAGQKPDAEEEPQSSSSEDEPDEHLAHENLEDFVSSAEEDCAQSDPGNDVSDNESSSQSTSDLRMDLNMKPDEEKGTSTDSNIEEASQPPTSADSTAAKLDSNDASSYEDDSSSTEKDAKTANTASEDASDKGVYINDEVSSVTLRPITTKSGPDNSHQLYRFLYPDNQYCDICCLKLIRQRRRSQATTDLYRCLPCAVQGTWDVCELCFLKGNWCRNRSHCLEMYTYSFRTSEAFYRRKISSSDVAPMTNIVVERRLSGRGDTRRPVSRFTRRLSNMLHDSGPVIHPTLPLLVFPLDGRKLLFLNMEASTYFTYDIPYNLAEMAEVADTCLPLSVVLHLSSCGKYLHVLRYTARNLSPLTESAKLLVVLFTVALNQENPSSGRPKISVPCCAVTLGSWPILVHRMPFTTTWTDTDAYIAVISNAPGPWLRVVRFPIRKGTENDNSQVDVHTLSEDITLPTSALFRPIYFFPATNKGAARIVLGCLHGSLNQPPVVVYLDRGKTGQWVRTTNLRMLSQSTYEHRDDAHIVSPYLYDECNAITSHDTREQITAGDGMCTMSLSLRQGLQEWARTALRTRNCPSCFQLGIRLCAFASPREAEYLNFEIGNPTQGNVTEDNRIKHSWYVTIPTLIQAVESSCQFCTFVATRLFRIDRFNIYGLFLGDNGPRCCANGQGSSTHYQEVREAIRNLRRLQRGSMELIRFGCTPLNMNGEARSFSKMIIEVLNIPYMWRKVTELGQVLPGVFAVKEGDGEDGSPDIMASVDMRTETQTVKFVMELHSLPDSVVHEWIPARPITTDRGGNENIAVIKGWLEECRNNHPSCWRKDNTQKPVDESRLPTRVLEITDGKSVRLFETQPAQLGQYTALSYCWGPDPNANTQTTRANLDTRLTLGIPRKDLPAVIQDAISINSKLSLNYIWVDALCIIQDDPDDTNRELSQMSAYYLNAYLTLTASTPACNKGFLGRVGRCISHTDFPLPRDLVPLHVFSGLDQSSRNPQGIVYVREENPYQLAAEPISQRAWTLQEQILSPRMLFFGGRVMWFCNAATRCDGGVEDWSFDDNGPDRLTRDFQFELIRGEHENSWNKNSALNSPSMDLQIRGDGKDGMNTDLVNLWHRVVSDYSGRRLSHPEDKLPAISAVAAEFARLCGSEYLAGLWRSNLARDLLWSRSKTLMGASTCKVVPTRSKRWRAPSWSWASVDDVVKFDRMPPSDAVQLAVIERAEVEPLTPEVPFGRLQDASGILEIKAPLLVLGRDGHEEERDKISAAISEGYSKQRSQDERSLLLETLRLTAREPAKEKQDTSRKGGMGFLKITQVEYEILEEAHILILFCKQNTSINSREESRRRIGEKDGESWAFWGLILEQVSDSEGRKVFHRVLAFADVVLDLGRNLSEFQKYQRTVTII